MATLAEFASLLQVGFGLGIGLSVFRVPVDMRIERISKIVDNEIRARTNIKTEGAKEKRQKLFDLKQNLVDAETKLGKTLRPCMFFAAAGAAINIIYLIFASIYGQENISDNLQWQLIFVSVIYYILIYCLLETVAWIQLSPIEKKLNKLRTENSVWVSEP
jgi:hypothetical protein